MTRAQLDALMPEGVGPFQAWLIQLGLALAVRLAPSLLDLVTVGAVALLARLKDAMVPAAVVDTALDIARGLERDHGPGAPLADQWPGSQRAEYTRNAIEQWMRDRGGNPDTALVNQVVEAAVGRLRAEQANTDTDAVIS